MYLTAIDCVGLAVWEITTGDFAIVPALLIAARLVLDSVFVASNFGKVRLTAFEFGLMGWILFGALLGVVRFLADDPKFEFSRIIKDTIPAFLFFCKIAILRVYLRRSDLPIRAVVVFMLLASVLNVAVFYILGGANTLYVGLTPPVNPAIAGSVYHSSAVLFLVALGVVYFSGKRSYLLSVGFYFALLVFGLRKLRRVVDALFFIRVAVVLLAGLIVSFSVTSPIIEKMSTAINGIFDAGLVDSSLSFADINVDDVEDALYLATAGRSAEVLAIVSGMNGADWIFGHGAGFTYSLELMDGVVLDDYANAHFSPLGLAYKYGAPFAVVLYAWLFGMMFMKQADGRQLVFWRGVAFLVVVQSFFAFNLFVEFLFPVALAAIQSSGSRFHMMRQVNKLAAGRRIYPAEMS